MNITKKISVLLLALVMALSVVGLFAFASAEEWPQDTSIDARADENGWITNYLADSHTTEHSVEGNMSTMTQAGGGPAYYGVNLYPLIAAGKDITFWVDNTESGTGSTYMGIVLADQKPEPWDAGFGFNTEHAIIGLIQNTAGWQVHKGASGAHRSDGRMMCRRYSSQYSRSTPPSILIFRPGMAEANALSWVMTSTPQPRSRYIRTASRLFS